MHIRSIKGPTNCLFRIALASLLNDTPKISFSTPLPKVLRSFRNQPNICSFKFRGTFSFKTFCIWEIGVEILKSKLEYELQMKL